jgi:cytoskeletal protein RodZ
MQTVGQYFKLARESHNISIAELEDLVKIKKEFLRNIEEGLWEKLPEYAVVLGFIKNISKALDLDEGKAVALFRRDYPQSKKIVDKPVPSTPKIKRDFKIGPAFLFGVGVMVVIVIILGYLGYQYKNFISPPKLDVFEPTQNQIVEKKELKVKGMTSPGVSIVVNNQPVLVNEKGEFETILEIYEGTQSVDISATSRSGKETKISRTIKPEIKNE